MFENGNYERRLLYYDVVGHCTLVPNLSGKFVFSLLLKTKVQCSAF